MKKRFLTNRCEYQFCFIPAFGIVTHVDDYKFRIAFLWGFWQASIGCFRKTEEED